MPWVILKEERENMLFFKRNKMKTAILLTGAAARISQETALLDGLMMQKKIKLQQNRVFLAGFSSGSLNILAINACFRKGRHLSWNKDFKEKVLFPTTTESIYINKTTLPYDTEPLKKKLKAFLKTADLKKLGDYSFPSRILVFSDRKLKTIWPYSQDPEAMDIPLLNLHMASTAIPVVFPWQKIEGSRSHINLPEGHFQDGGAKGIFNRFEEVLWDQVQQTGHFKDLYIISPMRIDDRADHEILIKDIRKELGEEAMKAFLGFLGDISQKMFLTFLQRLSSFNKEHKLAENIYVSIPRLKKNFPFIEFNFQREQHQATLQWIRQNPEDLAIEVESYLKRFS